jgi:ketosteroid isomerase-like protein
MRGETAMNAIGTPEQEALAAVAAFDRAFGTADVDAIMATMTADCVFEDTRPPDGRRHVGAAAVRSAWTALFADSARAAFTTEGSFASGHRVVQLWRYDFDGGHVRGVDVFTVRDGLVAEKLSYVKG